MSLLEEFALGGSKATRPQHPSNIAVDSAAGVRGGMTNVNMKCVAKTLTRSFFQLSS